MNFLFSLILALVPSDSAVVTMGPAPLQLPSYTYQMTPQEYYQWATVFNARERAASEERSRLGPSQYLDGERLEFSRHSISVVPTRYLNPDYTGPGVLYIVNPFCPPGD